MKSFAIQSAIFCISITVFVWHSSAQENAPGCEEIRSVYPYEEAYAEHMCRGIDELKNERYENAIASFEKAQEIDFFEAPNFESYSYLAHAHFLAKNIDKYQDYIAKSELALSVVSGTFACSFESDWPALVDELNRRIEGKFVQQVANEMCAEAYAHIYSPGASTPERIAWDRRLAAYFLQVKQMGADLHR